MSIFEPPDLHLSVVAERIASCLGSRVGSRVILAALLVATVSIKVNAQVCEALDPIYQDGLESTCGSCRDWVVDPEGDDDDAGTSAEPMLTIQAAANASSAGDRVVVRAGTYAGFRLGSDHSGTQDNPLIIRAEGEVLLDRAFGGFRDVIEINGADYVHVRGFRVRSAERAGIAVLDSRGVEVVANEVGPNGRWGIFTGFAVDLKVMFNRTFSSGSEHGIYISNSRVNDDNIWVLGNESFDNGRSGIQFNGDCYTSCPGGDPNACSGGEGLIGNSLIGHNRVYRNAAKGLSIISVDRTTIFNNVIYDNLSGAASVHLTDEPGCGLPTRDTIVVNNTMIEPSIAPVRITDSAFDNLVFNNIAVREGRSDAIVDEVGGNAIDTASNVVQVDRAGLFIADDDRFVLDDGSPARNVGVGMFNNESAPLCDIRYFSRPLGGTHDAGAVEVP